MKKSLVLAMAMALGVTASAYAANPFSDVPAGHWAYDSISKLAAAGVIEGYGDDTFRGDRLMTRYEMAQIVAKAMAKGANVDKLAAEFADELDKLNVRVAALEKKSDNVKITGQFRYHYASIRNKDNAGVKDDAYESALRSRLWFNGQVNDNWTYTAMLQNVQDLTDNVGNETTDFQRAYVDGRIGGVKVRAGRHDFQLADAYLYDTRMDGVKISYGDKVKFGAYYGKPTNHSLADETNKLIGKDNTVKYNKFYGANIGYEVGKLSLNAAYDVFDDAKLYDKDGKVVGDFGDDWLKDNKVWSIGAKYDFGKATLGALYLRSNQKFENYGKKVPKDGVVVTATYLGADGNKVGSWGLAAEYFNQGVGTFIAHTSDGDPSQFLLEGFSGYSVAGSVTVAKNMIAKLAYYDFKGRLSKDHRRTLWTEMTFAF